MKVDFIANKEWQKDTLRLIYDNDGRVILRNGTFNYEYNIKDHLGNNRVTFSDSNNDNVVTTAERRSKNDYYSFGMEHFDASQGSEYKNPENRYLYNGKEMIGEMDWDVNDYGARIYNSALGRFMQIDPMAVKYSGWSTFNYCGNNPLNRIDKNGKEWSIITDKNGNITINVTLNFSVDGNFTEQEIADYKNAISSEFNKLISNASGGSIAGSISFLNGDKTIMQTLSLDKLDASIGGMTSIWDSSVNLFDKLGNLKSTGDVASDATHEILHTLRMDHPFEVTQTEDTELLRIAPNSFISTNNTDPNILTNVMNYSMIYINGEKSPIQNTLTKGQLNFMIREIGLQNEGYGFMPIYNLNLSNDENAKIYKKYYDDYWFNTPGTPVKNK